MNIPTVNAYLGRGVQAAHPVSLPPINSAKSTKTLRFLMLVVPPLLGNMKSCTNMSHKIHSSSSFRVFDNRSS